MFQGPHHTEDENLRPPLDSFQTAFRNLLAALYRKRVSERALDNRHLNSLEGGLRGSMMTAPFHSYACLVWLHACRQPLALWKKQQLFLRTMNALRRLRVFARLSPHNHGHRPGLIEAEWLRSRGKAATAIPLYETAARQAEANGFAHEAALSRELLAEVCLGLGRSQRARELLRAAREGYVAWGATGKVRDLEDRYGRLLAETDPA